MSRKSSESRACVWVVEEFFVDEWEPTSAMGVEEADGEYELGLAERSDSSGKYRLRKYVREEPS